MKCADLARRIAREAPRSPGVYRFFAGDGSLLYVGKSVDLRARMLGYFRAAPDSLPRRIQDMVLMARGFSCTPTRSELEALLLEDSLIKRESPPVNVSQKAGDERSYLVLGKDAGEPLTVSKHAAGGRVFGPFKDRHHAAHVRDLLVAQLRLRRSLAPAGHAARLAAAVRFLEGDEGPLVAALEEAKARAAGALELEKAAEARDRIAFCRAFAERQRFVAAFRAGLFWIAERAPALLHVFWRGSWHVLEGGPADSGNRARIRALRRTRGEADERAAVDRALVVHRWMAAHEGAFESPSFKEERT